MRPNGVDLEGGVQQHSTNPTFTVFLVLPISGCIFTSFPCFVACPGFLGEETLWDLSSVLSNVTHSLGIHVTHSLVYDCIFHPPTVVAT